MVDGAARRARSAACRRFSPALPRDRLAAIGRLGFGRFEKVALRFAEPFWREAGFPDLMVFPRDPGEWMVWVMGLDAFGAGPALVFSVFHSAAEAWPAPTRTPLFAGRLACSP